MKKQKYLNKNTGKSAIINEKIRIAYEKELRVFIFPELNKQKHGSRKSLVSISRN